MEDIKLEKGDRVSSPEGNGTVTATYEVAIPNKKVYYQVVYIMLDTPTENYPYGWVMFSGKYVKLLKKLEG